MTAGRVAIYRLYDATDVLIYAGISDNPRRRWSQHADEKPWWPEVATKEVEWHASREDARTAELQVIKTEKPKYNIAETPKHKIVSARRRGLEDAHPLTLAVHESLEQVAAIGDPEERARVISELLVIMSEANGTVAKSRREAVITMRAAGRSYRNIGEALGVHFTRVRQIETGMPMGNSARSRAAKETAGE